MPGRAFLVFVCLVGLPAIGWATVYNAGSINEFKAALDVVVGGDEIRVAYGTYYITAADDTKHWFHGAGAVGNPIRVIGQLGPNGERPVFDASTASYIERGIFYLWSNNSNYIFENFEFRHARGNNLTSNNAAAAYILGDNITFRNCYSHHNDNGWFSGDYADNTLIEYCETAYNGYGDGYSHNYYVNSTSMTVRGNYIHHSNGGQNFKTRSRHLIFENNWLEYDGNYAWGIASGNQDNALMTGCVIIGDPSGNYSRIISISDGTSYGAWGTLTMIGNTIVSTDSRQGYIVSSTPGHTDVVMYNNIFRGASTTLIAGTGDGSRTGSNNWLQEGIVAPAGMANSIYGVHPGFQRPTGSTRHLGADSPCRDAGLNSPQWLNRSGVLEVFVPSQQYREHLTIVPRKSDGQLDIGAFEYMLGDMDYDGVVDLDDVAELASQMTGPLPMYAFDDVDGLIVMEAEHYSHRTDGSGSANGSSWQKVSDAGGAYVRSTPDVGMAVSEPLIETDSPRLSYDVRVNSNSAYFVWVKARATGSGSNAVHYGQDGDPWTTSPEDALEIAIGPDFTWSSTRLNGSRAVVVPKLGTHTIDLWMAEDGVEIDRILLVSSLTYVPDAEPESPSSADLTADLDGDLDVDVADIAVMTQMYDGP